MDSSKELQNFETTNAATPEAIESNGQPATRSGHATSPSLSSSSKDKIGCMDHLAKPSKCDTKDASLTISNSIPGGQPSDIPDTVVVENGRRQHILAKTDLNSAAQKESTIRSRTDLLARLSHVPRLQKTIPGRISTRTTSHLRAKSGRRSRKAPVTSWVVRTSVLIALASALISLVIGPVQLGDIFCAPVRPWLTLGTDSAPVGVGEAPWWSPKSSKADMFDMVCASRERTTLEWQVKRNKVRVVIRSSKGKRLLAQGGVDSVLVLPDALFFYRNTRSFQKRSPWSR